ncbi:MAG TPA: hypothetical protein VFZ59_21910 [Verrucomicrobiae bacterium]|nr:hypothetical protein [Verrucomicrobiae bacterium]
MIVYGDPQVRSSAKPWLIDLQRRAASRDLQLNPLRTLLIRAGQFEQAIADSATELESFARQITDIAAAAFYAAYSEEDRALPRFPLKADDALVQLRRLLERELPDRALTLKIPEGYAFYALYPEQYCQAAHLWHEDHDDVTDRVVSVVGIRSIGTSLSAVVAATLAAFGWRTERFTVRPQGHPFARMAALGELSGLHTVKARRAIIVDEGPGLSGSSMKAVADALQRAGFSPENIALFPGHDGEPGEAATPEIRAWWQWARRYCVPSLGVRTAEPARIRHLETRGLGGPRSGTTLAEALADRAARICGGELFEPGIDLGGGRWREPLFANEKDWPAVATSFERAKFLCRSRTRSVLWKYLGLDAAENGVLQPSSLATWLPRPLDIFHGFVALPWIEGEPLNRAAINHPSMIHQMARHVVALSQPPLSDDNHRAAVARLGEMLYWNVKESLNDQLADVTRQFANVAAECPPLPTYGDGHVAPHEWIRSPDGKIWKTDYFGHTCDHTMVGQQSILWDVAGTLIEWNMDLPAARALLNALQEDGGEWDLRPLEFYGASYAAFRLGVFSCATSNDLAEQRRLELARDFYRSKLEDALSGQRADYRRLMARTRTAQSSSSTILTPAGLTSRR